MRQHPWLTDLLERTGRRRAHVKPFRQFEGGAEGKVIRNWDLADNYSLSARVTQIDRRENCPAAVSVNEDRKR